MRLPPVLSPCWNPYVRLETADNAQFESRLGALDDLMPFGKYKESVWLRNVLRGSSHALAGQSGFEPTNPLGTNRWWSYNQTLPWCILLTDRTPSRALLRWSHFGNGGRDVEGLAGHGAERTASGRYLQTRFLCRPECTGGRP